MPKYSIVLRLRNQFAITALGSSLFYRSHCKRVFLIIGYLPTFFIIVITRSQPCHSDECHEQHPEKTLIFIILFFPVL